MIRSTRIDSLIEQSPYLSRDLSWLTFNARVLDQARKTERNIFEKMKFLAITASNLDEFFMIRVGSLYNYIDYDNERIDYSGLREVPFKQKLFQELQDFHIAQHELFLNSLKPQFEENGLNMLPLESLRAEELVEVEAYFKRTIYPMITPMVFDSYHTFPVLMNKLLIFGVITQNPHDQKNPLKVSFIQIPQNLPRFYEIRREDTAIFVPIENIIRRFIDRFFRNVEIQTVNLFRIIRNGDFTLEESDEMDSNFLDEVKRKLKTRKTGRVVRIEIEEDCDNGLINLLKKRWDVEDDNFFVISKRSLIDFSSLWQIIGHKEFKGMLPARPEPVPPLSYPKIDQDDSIFAVLKKKDVLMHHPFNSIEPLLQLLEEASEDPDVLAIKITIYRVAEDSRVTAALLKAAENGKHVSVLFEVKARFDEENNMREAKRLQQAGCFVIYGIGSFKTHTKLLQIVRKEGERITRYVHMSSGNYNEDTARLYTDLSLLTTREAYANDVSEFFNVITGHSLPETYENLITAPRDMRQQLILRIRQEAENARKGLPCGIVIKINSLEDRETIAEMYEASQAGVPIRLIVRGICCLRPGRVGLSENITVRSIVGEYLEHSRLYYFHNAGKPCVYSGSADIMVRSFDRRLESIFLILDDDVRREAINILVYNLRDNVNAYELLEDGSYRELKPEEGEPQFNIHQEFYLVRKEDLPDQMPEEFLQLPHKEESPAAEPEEVPIEEADSKNKQV